MASTAAIPIQKALISALFILSLASIIASAFQFQVGEEMAWRKPTGKERETYNEWASQNRFHIGDTLHFKYASGDSVVVVSQADYRSCSASNPIAKFEGGSTVYELNRPGPFYFISGQPGHCKSGQRLIVLVMHPFPAAAPEFPPSPSPAPSGERGGSGSGDVFDSPGTSSAAELFVAVPFFVAAFAGLLVTFYLIN